MEFQNVYPISFPSPSYPPQPRLITLIHARCLLCMLETTRNTPRSTSILQSYTAVTANMASVSSLDHDVKVKRNEGITSAVLNEAKTFIEEALGVALGPVSTANDLLSSLKDGVVLCKYAIIPAPSMNWTLEFPLTTIP